MGYISAVIPPVKVNRAELGTRNPGYILLWFLGPSPPLIFVYGDCTRNCTVKKYNFWGQFLTKKISAPGGNFLNYFTKILFFSQFYCLKSATLEIAYNIKIEIT